MTDTAVDLTEPQRKALAYLATVNEAAPAELGNAMGDTKATRYKAQVQGRRGATVGNRLVDKGLARQRWQSRPFSGLRYVITRAGEQALLRARLPDRSE